MTENINKCLLAAILNEQEYYDRAIKNGNIFLDNECRKIFQLITDIKTNNKQIIIDWYQKNDPEKIDSFLECYNYFYDREQFKNYYDDVLATFIKLKFHEKSKELIKDKTKSTIEIKQEILNLVTNVSIDEEQEITPCQDVLVDMVKNFGNPIEFTPSGIDLIDKYGGYRNSMGYVVIASRPSIGKGLWEEEEVLTEKGFIKIKDLKVSDYIYGENGELTKVQGIYNRGIRKTYRFTFNDKTSIICDEDHIWKCKHKTGNKYYKELNTKEILKIYNTIKDPRFYLPLNDKINFTEKQIDIDAYDMGVFLGDLHMSYTCLMNPNKEIINKLKTELRPRKRKDHYSVIGIRDSLRKYNLIDKLSYTKFIPKEYLYNSIKNRIKLLNGLMDTDGYCSKGGCSVYTTTSSLLRDDVIFLVRSLGGSAWYYDKHKYFTYKGERKKGRISYDVYININFNPFTITKKKNRYKDKTENYYKRIKKIEELDDKKCICLAVDNLSKTFLTSNFTVTHNTSVAINLIIQNFSDNLKVGMFSMEEDKKSIISGMACSIAGIDEKLYNTNLLNNQQVDLLTRAFDKLHSNKFYIDDTAGLDIEQFKRKSRIMKKIYNVNIIYLDYLQLLRCLDRQYKGRTEQVSYMSHEIKILSRELNIPIVALAQLNRENDKEKRLPRLSDLKDSGSIEQDADIVTFLHTDDPIENDVVKLMHIVAKFRKGGRGVYYRIFDKKIRRISKQ